MLIEDNFPEHFRNSAFHPTPFVYLWRKNILEKLFDEIMASDIAILSGEVWLVEKDKTLLVIPLKNGDIDNFSWKIKKEKNEEWYDFVERSCKETLELINNWDLEKKVRIDVRNKIFYKINFSEKRN